MGKIVAVLGNRGGVGKTSSAHLLAHGLALHGINVALIHTDSSRTPATADGRGYTILDTTKEGGTTLGQAVGMVTQMDGQWIAVIDGAGARGAVDNAIYDAVNDARGLTLLPFLGGDDDLEVAAADAARLKKALLIRNSWPMKPGPKSRADARMEAYFAETKVPDWRKRLVDIAIPRTENMDLITARSWTNGDGSLLRIPTPLNNAARALAALVIDKLKLKKR